MRRVYASMLALALGAGAATLAPDALARPPVVTIGIGFPVPNASSPHSVLCRLRKTAGIPRFVFNPYTRNSA